MTLAENIKEARKARGMSQDELAEMVNVHQTYISQVERGVSNLTIAMLERIADVLDCSIDGLLEREKFIIRKDF